MVLNEAVPLRQRTLQQREDDVEVASQVAKRQNKNSDSRKSALRERAVKKPIGR